MLTVEEAASLLTCVKQLEFQQTIDLDWVLDIEAALQSLPWYSADRAAECLYVLEPEEFSYKAYVFLYLEGQKAAS